MGRNTSHTSIPLALVLFAALLYTLVAKSTRVGLNEKFLEDLDVLHFAVFRLFFLFPHTQGDMQKLLGSAVMENGYFIYSLLPALNLNGTKKMAFNV